MFENVPKNLPADFLADFQTHLRDLEIALMHLLHTLINTQYTLKLCYSNRSPQKIDSKNCRNETLQKYKSIR